MINNEFCYGPQLSYIIQNLFTLSNCIFAISFLIFIIIAWYRVQRGKDEKILPVHLINFVAPNFQTPWISKKVIIEIVTKSSQNGC